RILVVVMIAISAAIALHASSIVDAVIIATVIGTTSYFFPIIGGLYWKRATRWGAMAALIVGGGTQILLIAYEQFWLGQPLDSISPYLTEHGVLVGLSLSALFFVGVSLATKPEPDIKLAPFFPDIIAGERSHLDLAIEHSPAQVGDDGQLPWETLVKGLKERYPLWFTPTGSHIVYRLSQADMLSCVKMVRGDDSHIWLSAEPRLDQGERLRDELFLAYGEIDDVLAALGMRARPG
ncbi:MAG: Na+/solute symporter, partial [Methanosaeta sp. ASP1-1]